MCKLLFLFGRLPNIFRHLLVDSGITTTSIEEAVENSTSKIIIFAIPKGKYIHVIGIAYRINMELKCIILNTCAQFILSSIDFYEGIVASIYDLLDGKIVIDVSNRNSVHPKMVM